MESDLSYGGRKESKTIVIAPPMTAAETAQEISAFAVRASRHTRRWGEGSTSRAEFHPASSRPRGFPVSAGNERFRHERTARPTRNNTRDSVNRAVNILRPRLRKVGEKSEGASTQTRSTRINVLSEQENRFQVGVPRAERAARHIYIYI